MNELDDFMKDYNTMKISRSRDQSEMTSVGYIPLGKTSYGSKLTMYEEKRDNEEYEHFIISGLITFYKEKSKEAGAEYKSPYKRDENSFKKLIQTYTKREIVEMILWLFTSGQTVQDKELFMPCWMNSNIYRRTQRWLKENEKK